MNVSARAARTDASAPERTLSDATLKAAGSWIAQFARALKTCRLYASSNPTVAKFREELAAAAFSLLQDHGALTYKFLTDDVVMDGVSLYPARSRDDNLAFPFHRDGVRGLTLQPGLEQRETDALLDCVLLVTGQNLDDDDLVTLLWEANLKHVDIDYIPAQGEVGQGTSSTTSDDPGGPLLPWPTASEADAQATSAGGGEAVDDGAAAAGGARSEDWMLGDLTVEVEASFVELDALAAQEVERFRGEFAAEHSVSPVTAALAISLACLRAGALDPDQREMGRFLPRVLRGALAMGLWIEAGEALRELRSLKGPDWSEETFYQELLQPVSITRVVERLDAQEPTGVAAFIALSLEIGDPGIDWLTIVLSESQQRLTRQLLAEAIAERCHENPERLAPWLSDGRWYVVRNIVHILGWIGGATVAGLLQVALRHPDTRVRTEVVGALQQVDLKTARPLLIRALDGADTKLFCQILHMLSAARDPATARFVYAFLQQERFAERPAEERRAIYAALASIAGDELVPELSAELLRSNWFDAALEIHRNAIARCLARIGTARARAALEQGAQSKRPPVRLAATSALGQMPAA